MKVDSLGLMVVQRWMMSLLGSLTTSRVLEVKARHCATATDPIRSVVLFVIIAQTVLEGL
jgi:hypothetical protein